MDILIRKKIIKLSEIVIKDDFKEAKPKTEKLIRYYHQYRLYNNMNNDIILDENNVLIDGYISYLIYKMFDADTVDVYINSVKTDVARR